MLIAEAPSHSYILFGMVAISFNFIQALEAGFELGDQAFLSLERFFGVF